MEKWNLKFLEMISKVAPCSPLPLLGCNPVKSLEVILDPDILLEKQVLSYWKSKLLLKDFPPTQSSS